MFEDMITCPAANLEFGLFALRLARARHVHDVGHLFASNRCARHREVGAQSSFGSQTFHRERFVCAASIVFVHAQNAVTTATRTFTCACSALALVDVSAVRDKLLAER